MQMLGWEATLGATLTFSLMCVALVLPGEDAGHLENMVHASLQMVHSPTVLFSVRQHGRSAFARSSHPPPQGPTRRSRIPPAGSGPAHWTWTREENPRRVDATEKLQRRSGGVPGPAPKSPMSLPLAVQVLTMALALLCFNIAGVYITKLQSATHRACVDATRQAVVWIHALLVGWEEFSLVELYVETKA